MTAERRVPAEHLLRPEAEPDQEHDRSERRDREQREQEQRERDARDEQEQRDQATQRVPLLGDLPPDTQRAIRIRTEEYIENLFVGHAPKEARSVPLDAETIEELRATFVKPACYRQAERVLDRRRVVVLVGPPHLGKRTAAALLAAAAPVSSVERIQSTATFDQLHDFDFRCDTAYFIDNLNPSQSDEQLRFLLEDLTERLNQDRQDSYLVVTLNRERRTFDDDLSPYLVDWSELPDRHRILRRHVEQQLGGPAQVTGRIADLLEAAEVRKRLDDLREPRAISELATSLVQEAAGRLAPGEALQRHSVASLAQIATRFQQAELHEQCVMIALAVLNGLPVSTVLAAATALRRRIRPDRRERGIPATSLNSERLQRTMLLETVGAEPLWAVGYRPYGRHPVRIARLRSDNDRQLILQHLWEEHDELHERVLQWLGDLVADERIEVYRAAALAIGTLALYDFAGILHLLEDWAGGDFARRGAAALALGEPAAEEQYESLVLGLLHNWRTRGSVTHQWTAAAAYGGYVGLLHPAEALRGLRELAERGNPTLRGSLSRALTSLFEAGDELEDLHRLVLEALLEWTPAEATKPLRELGRSAFVELTGLIGPRGAPSLLLLSRDDAEYQRRIATLWLRTLARRDSRARALARLRDWFRAADGQERLRPPLRQLVRRMAELTRDDQDGRDRLRYHLRRWASDGEASTAADCLQLLEKEEVPAP